MLTGKETSKTTRKVKIPKVRAKEGQNELKSTNPADSERKSSTVGHTAGGEAGRELCPKAWTLTGFQPAGFQPAGRVIAGRTPQRTGQNHFRLCYLSKWYTRRF